MISGSLVAWYVTSSSSMTLSSSSSSSSESSWFISSIIFLADGTSTKLSSESVSLFVFFNSGPSTLFSSLTNHQSKIMTHLRIPYLKEQKRVNFVSRTIWNYYFWNEPKIEILLLPRRGPNLKLFLLSFLNGLKFLKSVKRKQF